MLFSVGELIHEGKAEVAFFGAEVDEEEPTAVMTGGFPANLASDYVSLDNLNHKPD
jgi:hypothetical protein